MVMKIKMLAFLLIFLFLLSSAVMASDFCEGFKQGYITGYKQKQGTSLTPLTPLCPMQPLKGFGDPKSDFEHGYTIGYRKGMTAGYK